MTKKKKTLDTLVQDIYDKLDTLTEGKSLNVSEETSPIEIGNLVSNNLPIIFYRQV